MPNNAPAKVRISPKAIRTELWISPGGGTIKPVISRPQPMTIRKIAASNWIVGLCLLRFIFISKGLNIVYVEKKLYLCSDASETKLTDPDTS